VSLTLLSCERIYEEPKENIDEAIAFSSAFRAPLSLFETVDHISAVLMEKGLYSENLEPIEVQMGVEINLIDSTFADDDSVSYELVFLGETQHSFDRRKRRGKINVVIFKDYFEPGSQYHVSVDDSQPFELELSNGGIIQIHGKIWISRENQTQKSFLMDDLQLKSHNSKELAVFKQNWNLNGTIQIDTKNAGANQGLDGDEIKYSGSGTWNNLEQMSFNWEIALPLEMRFEYGCSDFFNKGLIKLQRASNRYFINFDPFGTAACNAIINITKAGKEFEVRLP
jgi:hypothetical protein